jgi:hypothetical protein
MSSSIRRRSELTVSGDVEVSGGLLVLRLEVRNPSILKTGRLPRDHRIISWLPPPNPLAPTCAQRTPARAGSFLTLSGRRRPTPILENKLAKFNFCDAQLRVCVFNRDQSDAGRPPH